MIVIAPADHTDDRALASLAAGVCGVPMTVVEAEEQALSLIGTLPVPWATRIRAPHGASVTLLAAARERGVVVDTSPFVGDGRVELPRWLLEQSVSRTMHRYGRLLRRSS